MERRIKRGFVALLAAAITVVALVAGTSSAAARPIVIGWAFDSKGGMAPFDGPALAAAQLRVKAVNAAGRRSRASDEDHHVRYPGQQAGHREGVCGEAPRPRAADMTSTT